MIELHELTKAYGARRAVDSLSVRIPPGRITGFLGPNGAGKTTTMRMILGLDAPSSGHALVTGRPYHDLRYPLRTVGAHITSHAGHPSQTPHAFLTALAHSNAIPRARVTQVLEEVGLAAVGRKRTGTFSLGMRQRLGIAAALLGRPQIIIFDEPMNGLDADGITWIRELMRREADAGHTVFVSSHLMSEMQQVADHIVLLGAGRLLADDATAALIAQAAQSTITVRTPSPGALSRVLTRAGIASETAGPTLLIRADALSAATMSGIGGLAHAHGIRLDELSEQHASLERVYSELTGSHLEFIGSSAMDNDLS